MSIHKPFVAVYLHRLFRCLVLWSHDTNLNDALKLAKSILIPIDVLNALWPCPGKSPSFKTYRTKSFIFIFIFIFIFYQLYNKSVIPCVNNSSMLVIPPISSSHFPLATLFHPFYDPEWRSLPLRYVWNSTSDLPTASFFFHLFDLCDHSFSVLLGGWYISFSYLCRMFYTSFFWFCFEL